MTALSIYLFEDDFPVRVTDRDGNPWFVGRDVCRVLGYKQPESAYRKLREREKDMLKQHTLGGDQTMTIVSEPGVYRLIASAKTAAAERFQDWLYHDVLPQIRRTGAYACPGATGPQQPPAPDVDIRYKEWQLSMVNATARLRGRAAALKLWDELGLPPIGAPADTGPDPAAQGTAALAILRDIEGAAIAAALGGDEAALDNTGIAVKRRHGDTTVHVASNHPHLVDLYQGTPFEQQRWLAALAALPGASRWKSRFGRTVRRCVRLPASLFQDTE